MSETFNEQEWIAAAADKLQLSQVGQTLPVEDYEKIEGSIPGLLAELAARNVIYVGSSDAVPMALKEPLAELLANACATTFGKPMNDALREAMEDRLRTMARLSPPPQKYLTTDPMLQGSVSYTYSRWLRGL